VAQEKEKYGWTRMVETLEDLAEAAR